MAPCRRTSSTSTSASNYISISFRYNARTRDVVFCMSRYIVYAVLYIIYVLYRLKV